MAALCELAREERIGGRVFPSGEPNVAKLLAAFEQLAFEKGAPFFYGVGLAGEFAVAIELIERLDEFLLIHDEQHGGLEDFLRFG